MAYTIQSGDTLSQIAQNNKTDVATLLKANPTITDANKIKSGASLNIPGASVSTAAPAANPVAPVPAPAVYNATPAINQANNAQSAIDNFNNATANKTAPVTTPATPAAPQTVQTPPGLPPAAAGMKYLYRTSDGAPVLFPLSANASGMGGYSDTPISTPNVNGSTVTDKVINDDGTQVQQLSNGTYVKVDTNGNVTSSATPVDFTTAQKNSSDYVNKQQSQAMIDLANKMDQITKGAYPLSASQQAQIDGVKSQLLSLVKEQETANANLTGATTIAMNLYGTGNAIPALGEIKGTIDSGIAKVADLQNKAAATIAQMTNAFNTNNMEQLKAAYAAHQSIQKQVQDNINKMYDDATKAANDLRNYNLDVDKQKQKQESDDRNYALDVQKYGLNASIAKANIEMKREQLQLEKQKANAYVNKLNSQTLAANILNKVSSATEGMSALNSDGTLNQDNIAKIKAALPPGIADTVIAVGTYKGDINSIKSAATRDTINNLAHSFFPSYDQKNYKAAQNYVIDYAKTSPSSIGGQKDSLNAMASHLDDLHKALSVVDSSSYGIKNKIGNSILNTGGPLFGASNREAVGNLNSLKQIYSEEALKYFKGAGAGENAAKRAEDLFAGNLSKEEATGALKGMITAINAKTYSLINTQKSTLGHIDSERPIMMPSAAIKLDKLSTSLGVEDNNFKEVLSTTPTGQVYLLNKTPEGAAAYKTTQADAIKTIGRPLSDDEYIQNYNYVHGGGGSSVPITSPSNSSSGVDLPPSSSFDESMDTIDTQ
jgi:hypothetical protein